ncbi:MAG TPA: hypothetical protein VND93_04245, partial [Myxococcales bacterium]|nr:hypothetical protein [Myxococcales bacterium]
ARARHRKGAQHMVEKERSVRVESRTESKGQDAGRERDDLDPERGRPRSAWGVSDGTAAGFHSAWARAIAEGLRAYSEEIDEDNVHRWGLDSGMVGGFLTGYATFCEEFSKAARRLVDDLRDDRERERTRRNLRRAREDDSYGRTPPIDYERLARMVAQELQKQRATTPAGPSST